MDDRLVLQELQREPANTRGLGLGRLAAAFAAGFCLVAGLGLWTPLFDTPPHPADVDRAYHESMATASERAEAYWQEELERRWWDAYKQGSKEHSAISEEITRAIFEGFSYDAGYEAGLRSTDLDHPLAAWRRGWLDGYGNGWSSVTGATGVNPPHPPDPPAPLSSEWSSAP